MTDLWSSLIPLIIGSAVVPVQIVVTILLLQSGGVKTGAAWVAGMTTTRLLQGALFGWLFASSDQPTSDSSGPSPVLSTLLLVLAVVFYVTALRHILQQDDEDAPPPKWMSKAASLQPGKAFLIGAGYVAIAAKFWVFTLAAAGAISDADLTRINAVLAYALFAVLTVVPQIALVVLAVVAPTRASVLLARASNWLEAKNRVIVIVLGLVFGTYFLKNALDGLGVI